MANVESMEISHMIYQMAKECSVSGNGSDGLMEYHNFVGVNERRRGLWESYKDKKILDVCAGLSDFTARLLLLGADAYAVDYGYADIQELLIRANYRPAGLFSKSVEQNKERYIKGSAHNLPFSSKTFDGVTSFYGIFGVLDDNVGIAYTCINECIRVLKPGGTLSIGPLLSGDITKKQAESEREILSRLRRRRDITIIVQDPFRKPLFGSFQDISRLGKLTIINAT